MKAFGRDGAKAPHVICAFGVEPLRVSIGIADYQSSRLPGGRPAAIPRQRSAWRPLGAGKARSAMPDTAALRQASMVSAGRWPARGARRAPSLSVRGVFPAPRPHAFSCDCSQAPPRCKGALRPVLTRSLPAVRLRLPGWPLHLGSTWLLSSHGMGLTRSRKNKSTHGSRGPQTKTAGSS